MAPRGKEGVHAWQTLLHLSRQPQTAAQLPISLGTKQWSAATSSWADPSASSSLTMQKSLRCLSVAVRGWGAIRVQGRCSPGTRQSHLQVGHQVPICRIQQQRSPACPKQVLRQPLQPVCVQELYEEGKNLSVLLQAKHRQLLWLLVRQLVIRCAWLHLEKNAAEL